MMVSKGGQCRRDKEQTHGCTVYNRGCMMVSKGGQCRRAKEQTHGCTVYNRGCLFFTESFVKLAASAESTSRLKSC